MDIIQIIFMLLILAGVGVVVYFLSKYLDALRKRNENEILHLNRAYDDRNKNIAHSIELLDMLKTVVSQNAVLMFRTFRDTHQQYDKVTKSALADFASDVAKASVLSLSSANISLRDTLLSEKFYTEYMVNTAMVYIKELHQRATEDYDPDDYN